MDTNRTDTYDYTGMLTPTQLLWAIWLSTGILFWLVLHPKSLLFDNRIEIIAYRSAFVDKM